MQKFTLAVVLAVLFSFNLTAQTTDYCGTDDQYHKLLEEYPELIQVAKDYEKVIQERIRENRAKDGEQEIFVIPVVFHVMHNYGPENISDEQIYDAINIMNRDFMKLNADISQVIPEFQDIVGKAYIQFRLANIAPDGSCTNGITRVPTILTDDGSNIDLKFNQWPPQSYLNIWVVRDMNSGAAAFSQYPSSVNTPATRGRDGIVTRYNYVGSIGESGINRQHTLSHEAGHYLNLQHVWGNTNSPGIACGDDAVFDTPVTKGYNYCPSPPSAAIICTEGVIENYQNFMDYSSCTHMFTEGQVERMRAALMSDMAHRDYLVSEQNNIYTGVADTLFSLCKPSVRFYLDQNTRFACTNQPIHFHSEITNGTAETYSWDFPTADVETSNEANPTVTYSISGWKTVTLTAGNASGTGTYTKEYTVYVYDADESISGNQIVEDFSDINHTYGRWIPGNANTSAISSGVNWSWSPVGCFEQGSMKVNIFDNPIRETYTLSSPKYNLEGKEGEFLSFKYAFATQGASQDIGGELEVKITMNCGETDISYLTIEDANQINTAGNYSDINFEPENIGMWKTAVIQIDDLMAQDGVQLVFELTVSPDENNFYIDDINIGEWLVSTDDTEVVNTLELYPNPAKDFAQLDFTLNRSSAMTISIFDLTGKKVKSLTSTDYATGPNSVRINTSDLSSGAYILHLQGDEINKSLKLLIGK